MKYNPIKKILILVTILAVPGFLYYLLQEKGKNRYKPLSIYGPKHVANTFHNVRGEKIPDTVYYILPDFKLINQQRDSISFATYPGKIILANLFYTSANSEGAKVAQKAMGGFAHLYEKNKLVDFISISIDPVKDSGVVLADYAKHISAVPHKWNLLTGDSVSIRRFAKEGLKLDFLNAESGTGSNISYTNMFVLLDSKHRIRGYYEATNQAALSKLDDEIKVLIAEELRNIKDGR